MAYCALEEINLIKAIINQLSSSVKIIANYAVGYNNVDVDAAKQREL